MPSKAAHQYWQELDLDYICDYMCSDAYTLPRWSSSEAKECALLYKRFLWLLITHPGKGLVPTKAIDEFWHNHILHTKQYIKDCEAMAGRYLHHTPHNPKQDDPNELKKQFQQTIELYQQVFAEPIKVFIEDQP